MSTHLVHRNDTEGLLYNEALTLFATKGFAATSVREIIEATGVTRPVLYYYCKSKQDLFEKIVRWKHDSAYEELSQSLTNSKNIVDSLRRIMRGTFAFCATDPRVPQLMFQATFGPVISELASFLQEMADKRFTFIAGVIHKAIDEGELHGGNAASLTLLFCSIMDHHSGTLSRMHNPERRLTIELADGLVDAFLFGVSRRQRQKPLLPNCLLNASSKTL